MPPRRRNKPMSTAVANADPGNDATMPKYPNKQYSEQDKEDFYAEFHGMENNADVYSFVTKETTANSRSKIFGVKRKAIKKAVEDFYSVEVKKVRTLVVPGKSKSRYTRTGLVKGVKSSYKKAMVELAEGESIDIFS